MAIRNDAGCEFQLGMARHEIEGALDILKLVDGVPVCVRRSLLMAYDRCCSIEGYLVTRRFGGVQREES